MAGESTDRGVTLAQVVGVIARASDLAVGQPIDHALRSCVIATRFADQLGVREHDRAGTYWTTLLLNAGCNGVAHEVSQLFGDDIAFQAGVCRLGPSHLERVRYVLSRAGSGMRAAQRARVRAELVARGLAVLDKSLLAQGRVSAMLADRLGLGPHVVTSLHQTYAQWGGNGVPPGVRAAQILLPVRIANLATMVEVHHRERGAAAAAEHVRDFSGTFLDPELVDAWQIMGKEILDGIDGSPWDEVMAAAPGGAGGRNGDGLRGGALDAALEIVADYADLKSPWFTGHSRGVAALATAAGEAVGMHALDLTLLRRAALVHDIGRAGVPDTVWNKPASLDADEWQRVRRHAYDTDQVLRRIGPFDTLATIAASAYERSDGSGYPKGIGGDTIPMLGRFLAAADTYHAMTEERPHRPRRTPTEARKLLRGAAREGRYDPIAVDAVLRAATRAHRDFPMAPSSLSEHEAELLELAARGGTTKTIATSLGTTPKTIGEDVERAYAKVGVTSRPEAALYVMSHDLA